MCATIHGRSMNWISEESRNRRTHRNSHSPLVHRSYRNRSQTDWKARMALTVFRFVCCECGDFQWSIEHMDEFSEPVSNALELFILSKASEAIANQESIRRMFVLSTAASSKLKYTQDEMPLNLSVCNVFVHLSVGAAYIHRRYCASSKCHHLRLETAVHTDTRLFMMWMPSQRIFFLLHSLYSFTHGTCHRWQSVVAHTKHTH